MRSAIRLVAIDIDGTLLDPHFQITPRNLQALQAAYAEGVEIILATGRRHDYALPVARELGFPVSLISSNGALVRASTGETFFSDYLPSSTVRRLIGHMNEFRGNAVLTFDRPGHDALVLESADELNRSIARWIQANAPYIHYVRPLENALQKEDPIQAMFCGTVARMKQAEAHLGRAPFTADITVLKTQYDQRDLCILDVLNRDCSKGHALRRWAEEKRIPREQILAIGDNFNDVEMLEYAGVAVVMGNASDELKKSGWRVTASNTESGVAVALEQLLGTGLEQQIRVK